MKVVQEMREFALQKNPGRTFVVIDKVEVGMEEINHLYYEGGCEL